MNIKNLPIITLNLLLVSFFIFSCKRKNESGKTDHLKSVAESTIGKVLQVPHDLKLYEPYDDYQMDSTEIGHSLLKIYSKINVSCGTCIEDIKDWREFNLEITNYNIPIIIIAESDDNFELLKYLCKTEQISGFPYPFFLAKNNDFSNSNKFMKETKHYETVLTDSKNNILLIGNPIRSNEIKKIYLQEMQHALE